MSSEGPNNGATFVNDATVGATDWTNPSNAQTSNDSDASSPSEFFGSIPTDYHVKLVVGGSIVGNAITGTNFPSTDTYQTFGGASELWGLTPSAAEINASDFGCVYSCNAGSEIMHYIKCTNFSFSIPAGATINGIQVDVERAYGGSAKFGYQAFVDHIRITVYYTEGGGGGAENAAFVNISDAWRKLSEAYINVGDTWRTISELYINVGDVWHPVLPAA